MEKLNEKLVYDLLLTKAICEHAEKEEILDELLSNEALDREEYLHNIMELTQLGYVDSNIEMEEDIKMSEAVGFDITGLTTKGMEYVTSLENEPTMVDKIKTFFKDVDDICGKIADSGIGKLAGTIVLPALSLFR